MPKRNFQYPFYCIHPDSVTYLTISRADVKVMFPEGIQTIDEFMLTLLVFL